MKINTYKKILLFFFLIIFWSIKSQISFSKDICLTVSECLENGYKLIKEESKIVGEDVIKIFQLKKGNTVVLCSNSIAFDGILSSSCKII